MLNIADGPQVQEFLQGYGYKISELDKAGEALGEELRSAGQERHDLYSLGYKVAFLTYLRNKGLATFDPNSLTVPPPLPPEKRVCPKIMNPKYDIL